MRKLFILLLLTATYLFAEIWIPKNSTNAFSAAVGYQIDTKNDAGVMIDLSYNYKHFTIGTKGISEYKISTTDDAYYIGYLLSDFELSIGYGQQMIISSTSKDYYNYGFYSVKYFPVDFLYISAQQHFLHPLYNNYFIFSAGIIYTADYKPWW